MRCVYAAILATTDAEGTTGAGTGHPDDLDLYDVERHLRAVLEPVFAWAVDPETHQCIADTYNLPVDEVSQHLYRLEQAWRDHAEQRWWGLDAERPTIVSTLLPHLVVLQASLRDLMRHPPTADWYHADLLLLFAAHYLQEAHIERLWTTLLSDVADPNAPYPPPEDVPGHWFWPTWLRLLEALEPDASIPA